MTVEWNQDRIIAKIRKGAMQGVVVGAAAVHDRASALIQGPPKTGRWYGAHQASAPGEAPASDTGRLAQSGDVTLDEANLSARVNWSTNYAEALEKGSTHTLRSVTATALQGMKGAFGPAPKSSLAREIGTERMEARPFARPALADSGDDIRRAVADRIQANLK